jgi:hypothetical protein
MGITMRMPFCWSKTAQVVTFDGILMIQVTDHIKKLESVLLPGDSGKENLLLISTGIDHHNLDKVFIHGCIQTLHAKRTIEIYPFSLFRIKLRMLDAGIVFPFLAHHQQSFLPSGVADFEYNAVSHL